MAKVVPSAIIDLMLQQAQGTKIHVCSGASAPANFAGIAAVMLAEKVMVSPYPGTAAGDVSGRKNPVSAQTLLPISNTGNATHVVISNGTSTMYLVTTCTSQLLTSGGTVDTATFDHEILAAS
jgi:hypothetical protein